MNKIYVLINVQSGTAKKVMREITKIKNVVETSIVSGRYDVLAKLEGKSLAELTDVIINRIHKIDGVERTESLIALVLDITGEEGPPIRTI